jgi:hypothetical protein
MNYISAAPSMGAFDVFTYAKELEKTKAAEAKAAEAKAADAKAKAIAAARDKAKTEMEAAAVANRVKVAADVKAGRYDPTLPNQKRDAFTENLYKQYWLATGTPLPQGVSPPTLPSGGPSGDVDLPAPPSSVPLVVAGAVAVAVVAFLLMRKKG